jgi:Domain of unknown function (DUF4193)
MDHGRRTLLLAPRLHPHPAAVQSARIEGTRTLEEVMNDTMSEIDEPIEEDVEAEEADDAEEAEPTEAELAQATVPPDPNAPEGEVESIQELLTKQEAAEEEAEEEEEVVLTLTKEEKLAADPTDTRVVPMQETEFVCKRCFLVKHRGQLADKKKMLCRDCA